jgi:hypothetical protein
MKPEIVPKIGPSSGAVRLECRMLENVIWAPVPRIGYAGMNEQAKSNAVQTAIRAMFVAVSSFLGLFSVMSFLSYSV